jgi:hypothetical protein
MKAAGRIVALVNRRRVRWSASSPQPSPPSGEEREKKQGLDVSGIPVAPLDAARTAQRAVPTFSFSR